jgi:hypothetical protein
VEFQNQVVGAEARDVGRGVPAFERVVEVVRQEDRLELGRLPDGAVPGLAVLRVVGALVEVVDGVGVDPVAFEAVEGPGDFEEPGILDRVVDPVEVPGEVAGPGSTSAAGIPAEWASSV